MSQPPGDDRTGLQLLDEENGDRWLKALIGLLKAARSLTELQEIQRHRTVVATLDKKAKTPSLIRSTITDAFKQAHERLAQVPETEEGPGDPPNWSDPVGELIAEVNEMGPAAVNDLASNAQWRARARDATADFPPDEDRLNEAIAARKAVLQQGRQ